MGLFDWVAGQFIDVIEWTDSTQDTMVYRFNRHNNEIKYGAKLIVRESQVAIFVNGGEIADVFEPGTYELETQNMPIMTSLEHWDHGFNSPFKAEVYFINTKRFTNLRWGTKNPIMVRDPEFSMVRLRAFGTYETRVSNPEIFLKEIVGTNELFTIEDIDNQLTNLIVTKFTQVLGESKVSILDLTQNYEKFSKFIEENISGYFKEYGLELSKLLVENISLPEAVEKALDKRTSREITGDLDAHTQYQAAEALGNTHSSMSEMAGIGAGLAMGQNMAQQFSSNKQQTDNTPPPLPSSEVIYHVAIDGKQQGPYSKDDILRFVSNGTVKRDTLIWRSGEKEWQKADILIPSIFNNTPPPLP